MPWTGAEFASRHNHKLKGAAADHAARQANAMLRAGVPEGEAIATANKHADKGKTKVARLTAKTRSKIPTSKFAGPGRSYPVQDKAHAKAAIGLAAMHHSPDRAAIDAKAERVLKGSKTMKSSAAHGKAMHAKGNAHSDGGMRHGTTKATGGLSSRFDRMSKASSKMATGKRK